MKKTIYCCIVVALFLATVLTSCKTDEKEEEEKFKPSITISTATTGMVTLKLAGEGNVLIDWGQGEKIVEMTLSEYNDDDWVNSHIKFTRSNFITSSSTITISHAKLSHFECGSGTVNCISNLTVENDWLQTLFCYGNALTYLDLRSAPNLMVLHCFSNRLTSLDLSRNSKLFWVNCYRNQLTSLILGSHPQLWTLICTTNNLNKEALNNIFGTLNNSLLHVKNLYISGNPGSAECDRSIAEEKGWKFIDN